MVVDDEPGKRRIRRPQQKYVPLSKEAKAAGIKWLMADGVRTEKDARRLESIFVQDVKKIKGYETQLRDYGVDPMTFHYILETCQSSGVNVDDGLAKLAELKDSGNLNSLVNPNVAREIKWYKPYIVMYDVLCLMGVDKEKAHAAILRAHYTENSKERIGALLSKG